jgi:hypothetical protein
MATIKENGGAASVWKNALGARLVVCRNCRILQAEGRGRACRYTRDPELVDWGFWRCEPPADFDTMLRRRGWVWALGMTKLIVRTTVAAYRHMVINPIDV